MIVKTFPVGPLQCNCTILGDPDTGKAIVVDPGGDAEKILETLKTLGLHEVVNIIHTHAHFDHFLASGQLQEATQAPISLHPDDKPLWEHLDKQCAIYGIPYQPVPLPDRWLNHEENLVVGAFQGKALHTPGHSPGSMSFLFDAQKVLIAGDTLFKGSIGRTDLWGGDYETIERSIRERLYTLDEELQVIPGHGPLTLLGDEMRSNSYIRA